MLIRIRDLERNTKFSITNMELVDSSFGKRICVKTDLFQFLLPKIWAGKFTEEQMAVFTYFVYKGKIKLPNGQIKLDMDFM